MGGFEAKVTRGVFKSKRESHTFSTGRQLANAQRVVGRAEAGLEEFGGKQWEREIERAKKDVELLTDRLVAIEAGEVEFDDEEPDDEE